MLKYTMRMLPTKDFRLKSIKNGMIRQCIVSNYIYLFTFISVMSIPMTVDFDLDIYVFAIRFTNLKNERTKNRRFFCLDDTFFTLLTNNLILISIFLKIKLILNEILK